MIGRPLRRDILRPSARIAVSERGGRSPSTSLQCVIGRDLQIDVDALSSYCFRPLSSRVDDLVLIAGVVAFADRAVTRRTSQGWSRDLEVVMPVHDPDFWNSKHVNQSLINTLDSLTGDSWQFGFKKRRLLTETSTQTALALSCKEPPITMPYSDGLDLLAVARLVSLAEREFTLILVTTGTRRDCDEAWRARHLLGRRHRVSVPFRFPNSNVSMRFREPSYRSRAFVFGVMAGVAAHFSEGRRVVFPESGQGSLGPWLVPVGNEAPDVRSNPVFTRKLAAFLKRALETHIEIEHPRLWSTKGETLRELVNLRSEVDWANTRSCARDARHMHLDGARVQCGVCAACLLTRQSIFAAGLGDSEDRYYWSDLSAATLTDAARRHAGSTDHNDERHAVCGALAMRQLADAADDLGEAQFDDTLTELVDATGCSQSYVRTHLKRVLQKHRQELSSFVEAHGPTSFLAHLALSHP